MINWFANKVAKYVIKEKRSDIDRWLTEVVDREVKKHTDFFFQIPYLEEMSENLVREATKGKIWDRDIQRALAEDIVAIINANQLGKKND